LTSACRTIDGLKPLVRMLERSSTPAVVAAALDALRAICVNNDENKAKVSVNWLVPQLVKLMGSQVRLPHACLVFKLTIRKPNVVANLACGGLLSERSSRMQNKRSNDVCFC